MKKLSTGADSTLGEWRKLVLAVFGVNSESIKLIDKKIKESPNGENEEVIADESQLIQILFALDHAHSFKDSEKLK